MAIISVTLKDPDYEEPEDSEDEDEDDGDLDSWWAKINGVSSDELWKEYYAWEAKWKTGDYSHDSKGVEVFEKKNPKWREALDKYYEDKRTLDGSCPVELIRHCSCDYPMYILAAKGQYWNASRGTVVEIDDLTVNQEARMKLKEFCRVYDIKFTPKWLLASDWC